MKFDYQKFKSELTEEVKQKLNSEEIDELLELGESYSKDNPMSTGKNLVINRLAFKGKKDSTQLIDFNQELSNGVNIWIADNLKGKSSIFKIIKYALTGNSSLKPDVSRWLTSILLNFSIGNKNYSIHLNMEGNRLKVDFYNFKVFWDELESIEKEPLFQTNNEKEYREKIQEFFFNQFSYYSLKWTQKSSSKESNELLEAEASWKTYFKSIFLESRDSYDLVFGDQGKKIFQMLLGLELTYPINQLMIKRDFIKDEKGKEKLLVEANAKKYLQNKSNLEDEQKTIVAEIEQFNKLIGSKSNIGELNTKYNLLKVEYGQKLNQSLKIQEEIDKLKIRLNEISIQQENIQMGVTNAKREKEKNEKRLIELNEFVEIGIFFSNLDIKHCPSCNHTIDEEKKKYNLNIHKCVLCDEEVKNDENDVDVEEVKQKIRTIKSKNQQIDYLILQLENEKEALRKEYNKTYSLRIQEEQKKEGFKDLSELSLKLSQLEQELTKELQKPSFDFTKKEELIAKKAVVEFKLNEIKVLYENLWVG
ncbi:MAG: hypothetical protein H6577_23670 [Lewinellaceae bacterium]|nr:hypothetical protein [Saprospiraceae bacterium]MCB9341137.1 hypothetical protein [Lewinellaceae bacterium]